jgi:hypothetical protein
MVLLPKGETPNHQNSSAGEPYFSDPTISMNRN